MKLYEPVCIGQLELRNRICMAPMANNFNTREDGSPNVDHNPTQNLIDYYVRRAAGGVGLIILEQTEVNIESTKIRPFAIGLYDDRLIPGMSKLASAVHSYDTKVAPQLHSYGSIDFTTRFGSAYQVLDGSPAPGGPMELSEEDIWKRIGEYAEAARRAKAAGFDCVEFHGAHQHPLAAQFSSFHMNKRTDKWGGSIRNRARFAQEAIRRAKERAGKDFPIIWRFCAVEFVDDGMTLEEAKVFAKLLEEAGADALHVSGGTMETVEHAIQPNLLPVGYLVPLAEAVKKEVKIPVITVGRITSPRFAESILQKGKADLVALGRPLFADPDWPRKGLEGRHHELRVCLGCNTCFDRPRRPTGSKCLLNPELGRRREFVLESTRVINPKKVLVVGGGPAGLEAARVAQNRGHQVTLCEEKDRLGGHWSWLIRSYLVHKKKELEKLGVKLELGKKATPGLVDDLAPELVIATDEAAPIVPSIPGIEQANVFTADDVLAERTKLTGKVVILGGTAAACETAMYLRGKGVAVTMIEKGDSVGMDIAAVTRPVLIQNLVKQRVEILTCLEATRINGTLVTCVDLEEKETVVEADNVVVALGYQMKREFVDSLRGSDIEVYSVVHCEAPGAVMEAVEDGAAVARRV